MTVRVVLVLGVLLAVGALCSLWLRIGRRSMGRPLPTPVVLGRRRNWMEGRQILVYGKLGAGKTDLVMQRAIKLARRNRLPLYANAPVRDDAVILRSWDDISKIPLCTTVAGQIDADPTFVELLGPVLVEDWQRRVLPCVNSSTDHACPGCHPAVLVLDEVHLWLPSQNGLMPADVVRSAIHLLSYARKRGWTIFATTQYPTRVSTQFRYLCTEMLEVRAFSQGLLHFVKQIDPDTGKEILPFAGLFFPRRARYNTRAEVEPLWSLGGSK